MFGCNDQQGCQASSESAAMQTLIPHCQAPVPGNTGNPQGRSPATTASLGKGWRAGAGPKSCPEEMGQECPSALCSQLGYGGTTEKLIFGWKEVPCQARQTGGGKYEALAGGCRVGVPVPLSLVNNSAALSVHLFLHWSQRELPCPPSNICLAIVLCYILGVFFFLFELFFCLIFFVR